MKKIAAVLAAFIVIAALAGCSAGNGTGRTESQGTASNGTLPSSDITAASAADVVNEGEFSITSEDGTVSRNGNVYTLTAAGEYTLSGTLEEGQIVVSAGDDDEVRLLLNGVTLTSSTDNVIYVENADKVVIHAVEGTENAVADRRTSAASEETAGGAIYATSDLNISGKGVLVVESTYNNGIHTTKDLKVKNLTLSVTAANHALKGNDSVTVESGTLTLVSLSGDSMKATDTDVSSKGNQRGNVTILDGTVAVNAASDGIDAAYGVSISGGTLTISAGDDGIHAEETLLVTGGTVNVLYAHEGLEGHYVTVEGGTTSVYATDDGVNATGSSSRSADGVITVTGGTLFVEVEGRDIDGIDANGNYVQTGGFVVVSNPGADSSGNTAAVDTDGSVSVTGGILIALGTVPGAAGQGMGGRFGMGGMNAGSSLPSGYVTFSGTLSSGSHTFTYGGESHDFTLTNSVSSGWIWADGISESNYSLD